MFVCCVLITVSAILFYCINDTIRIAIRVVYWINVGEERLRRAPPYDGPHGLEKHSTVLAKLTNTVSRYSQEGTI